MKHSLILFSCTLLFSSPLLSMEEIAEDADGQIALIAEENSGEEDDYSSHESSSSFSTKSACSPFKFLARNGIPLGFSAIGAIGGLKGWLKIDIENQDEFAHEPRDPSAYRSLVVTQASLFLLSCTNTCCYLPRSTARKALYGLCDGATYAFILQQLSVAHDAQSSEQTWEQDLGVFLQTTAAAAFFLKGVGDCYRWLRYSKKRNCPSAMSTYDTPRDEESGTS